jgi:hypothetical protein
VSAASGEVDRRGNQAQTEKVLVGGIGGVESSVDVDFNPFTLRLDNVTNRTIVLIKRVLNILSIRKFKNFTVAEVAFALLQHILKEGIRFKKSLVVPKALTYFVCLAHIDNLQFLVKRGRNAIHSRIFRAVKRQAGLVVRQEL